MSERSERWGEHAGFALRSREKGASLFTMIPLERWNVERRDTFLVKVKGRELEQPSSRSPIRQMEHGQTDTFHRLWNAVAEHGDLLERAVNRRCLAEPKVYS